MLGYSVHFHNYLSHYDAVDFCCQGGGREGKGGEGREREGRAGQGRETQENLEQILPLKYTTVFTNVRHDTCVMTHWTGSKETWVLVPVIPSLG